VLVLPVANGADLQNQGRYLENAGKSLGFRPLIGKMNTSHGPVHPPELCWFTGVHRTLHCTCPEVPLSETEELVVQYMGFVVGSCDKTSQPT